MPAIFSIIGLALNLMGVIVLFRYGMPYKVRMGGAILLTADNEDEAEKAFEVEYGNLGLFGLGAVLIGTAFQIIGAIVPH